MKTFKFIIIISIILLMMGCGKPTLVNTIEKTLKVDYIAKQTFSSKSTVVIYTRTKIYIFEDIDCAEINSISLGGTTYVYKDWGSYSFKSELVK